MKIDTLLILGGLAGIAYMLKQPKPVTRREVTRNYKDGDPEAGEIGLAS
jgi:hypothetical protein